MRAWFTMTCGNSDKPSSVSWTRPVRTTLERSFGEGRQNVAAFDREAMVLSLIAATQLDAGGSLAGAVALLLQSVLDECKSNAVRSVYLTGAGKGFSAGRTWQK